MGLLAVKDANGTPGLWNALAQYGSDVVELIEAYDAILAQLSEQQCDELLNIIETIDAVDTPFLHQKLEEKEQAYIAIKDTLMQIISAWRQSFCNT